jgi:ElaB/YqjD/DUF883 family membrane-anchored ribosome-binding protein
MDRVGESISNVTEPAMDAMGRAGDKLKETGSSITNIVQQNPIPCALIGLGLGWFVVNRIRNADGRTSRSRAYQPEFEAGMAVPRHAGMEREYGRSHGEYAGASRQYGGSARNALNRVKETAGELTHETAERVSHLGHQAKEGAVRAGRTFQHFVQENPLAVGAAAVAVGAVVGLALPATRIEHEYMGETSEKLVDKAQQVARDAMDKVKTAAQGETGNQPQAGGQPQPGQPQPGNQTQASNQPQSSNQGQAGSRSKGSKQGQQPGLNG